LVGCCRLPQSHHHRCFFTVVATVAVVITVELLPQSPLPSQGITVVSWLSPLHDHSGCHGFSVALPSFLRHRCSTVVALPAKAPSLQSPSPSHPHVITVAVASSMSPFSRSPSLLPRRHFPPSLVLLSPQSPSPSLSHRITAVAAAFPLWHCHRFFAVRRRQGIIAAVHIIIASSLSCHRCCVVAVTVTLPLMHRRWRH